MKRIIYPALCALLGIFVSSTKTSAQTVYADIEATLVSPAGDETNPFVVPCTDSFDFEYFLINRGPGVIGATDTVFYYSPFAGQGFINYTAHGGLAVAVDDTIFHDKGKIVSANMERLWDPSDGTPVYPPFADGDYLFLILARGYATDTTVINDTVSSNDEVGSMIRISCTSSIKDANLSKTNLKLYPNPAYNFVSFEYNFTAIANARLRILDIAGRTIETLDLGKQNNGVRKVDVDISKLNKGMYYLELTTNDTKAISKFTKE